MVVSQIVDKNRLRIECDILLEIFTHAALCLWYHCLLLLCYRLLTLVTLCKTVCKVFYMAETHFESFPYICQSWLDRVCSNNISVLRHWLLFNFWCLFYFHIDVLLDKLAPKVLLLPQSMLINFRCKMNFLVTFLHANQQWNLQNRINLIQRFCVLMSLI